MLVEDLEQPAPADIMTNGPYHHQGPGSVSHGVGGLKKGHTYSAIVRVDSLIWTRESDKYNFGERVITLLN